MKNLLLVLLAFLCLNSCVSSIKDLGDSTAREGLITRVDRFQIGGGITSNRAGGVVVVQNTTTRGVQMGSLQVPFFREDGVQAGTAIGNFMYIAPNATTRVDVIAATHEVGAYSAVNRVGSPRITTILWD